MEWHWLATNLVAAFLLPPLNLLLLGGIGLWRWRSRLGQRMLVMAWAGLWILSTPWIAGQFLASLQLPYAPIRGDEAEAIVVLGGGLRGKTPEYGGDTLHGRTLERVRYGAWLHRRIGKPILVTGGAPTGETLPEGQLMRATLEQEFKVPVAFMEDRSSNTRENARFSAPLLREAGIHRIYLVSHVWHLPRAIPEFEREGLVVVPAGIDYHATDDDYSVFDFIPSPHALVASYYAFHEWIGRVWYVICG